LKRDRGDPELRLRLVQARQLVLVEALVRELADVAHERSRERGLRAGVAAARPERRGRRDRDGERDHGRQRNPTSYPHLPSSSSGSWAILTSIQTSWNTTEIAGLP